jgi:PPOX class probable F420-dependent enzyme
VAGFRLSFCEAGGVTRTQRLLTEQNVWLATVRPDGRPHLTPIWFVWTDDHLWVCTGADSVKVRNVRRNPKVSVALESGNSPVAGEGTAHVHVGGTPPPPVVDAFVAKYDWDITSDADYGALIEIEIVKWLYPGADPVPE